MPERFFVCDDLENVEIVLRRCRRENINFENKNMGLDGTNQTKHFDRMMLCNMCGSNVEENVSFESAENGFRCWQKFRVMLPKCMGGRC